MEQEVIITNHNLLFHFSDPSKKMLHTFLHMNPAIDWSWSVTKSLTKLKAILYLNLFLSIFNLSKRNLRYLLEFSRIDRFPFSIAMEAPPHVRA